jgi:hypothetical protein
VRSIRLSVGTGAVYCIFCPLNNAAMSSYICNTAYTIFVVLLVDVEVSSYSMILILFRRFSIL